MSFTDAFDLSSSSENIWLEVFKIRTYETDSTGHLSPLFLCRFFQEAAGNHAHNLGLSVTQLVEQKLTWMLSRFHVKFFHMPAMHESVFVETWPSGHNRLYATREYHAFTEDGTTVAQGTSAWLMLDLGLRKPIRIPAMVDNILLPDRERPIPDPFLPILPATKKTLKAFDVQAYLEDQDLNRHVNSNVYLDWIVRSVPAKLKERAFLKGIEIQYKAEVHAEDSLVILSNEDRYEDTNSIWHQIVNREGEVEKEVAIAKSTWQYRTESN